MLSVRWWDLAAIVAASVIVVLTLIDPPYGPTEWGAWAAAGAFLVVYFAAARRLLPVGELSPYLVVAILFAAVLAVGTAFFGRYERSWRAVMKSHPQSHRSASGGLRRRHFGQVFAEWSRGMRRPR